MEKNAKYTANGEWQKVSNVNDFRGNAAFIGVGTWTISIAACLKKGTKRRLIVKAAPYDPDNKKTGDNYAFYAAPLGNIKEALNMDDDDLYEAAQKCGEEGEDFHHIRISPDIDPVTNQRRVLTHADIPEIREGQTIPLTIIREIKGE